MADENILEQTFHAATDAIGVAVTTAMQKGHAASSLAMMVERSFDGRMRVACAPRDELGRRLAREGKIEPAARTAIAAAFEGDGEDALPIVIVVHCEGYGAVGVRRERGATVAVS